MVPAIAMLMTNEVKWSVADFIVMGLLLALVGFGMLWILSKFKTPFSRIVLLIFLLFVFLLIWAELAVGVFNSPFAGN